MAGAVQLRFKFFAMDLIPKGGTCRGKNRGKIRLGREEKEEVSERARAWRWKTRHSKSRSEWLKLAGKQGQKDRQAEQTGSLN